MTQSSPPAAAVPTQSRMLHQLRRFAAVGLTLGLIFVIELVLLSTFGKLRTGLWNGLQGSDGQIPFTVLGVTIAVVALLACAVILRRRHAGLPRANLWFGLSVPTILVLWLCGVAWLPAFDFSSDLALGTGAYLILLVVGVPAVAIWMVRLLGRRFRWGLVGGYLVLVPVFAYLATDDATLERNTTLEEIAPVFPGAEASYEVTLRYGKRRPLGKNLRGPERIWKNFGNDMSIDPEKPDQFRRFLTAQRDAIQADWADLAPVRAWWAELATFARIGDLTQSNPDVEILPFQPVRSYSQLAIAIAGLQALDGQGDAAFATLQPLIEVSRKLEPSSRTLVRSMIALVSKGQALSAAGFVLDTTPVSPAARARFATALTGGVTGEAGARRLIAIESSFVMAMLQQPESPYLRYLPRPPVGFLKGVVSVVYNPRRTSNLLGEHVAELQDMAARRDFANMNHRTDEFLAGKGRPHFKNFLGGMVLKHSAATYGKIIESYWAKEDQRIALLARLNQP